MLCNVPSDIAQLTESALLSLCSPFSAKAREMAEVGMIAIQIPNEEQFA